MSGPDSPLAATRSYSIRHRLDMVSGVLVLLSALTGSVALDLTQRQRADAMLVRALHEEERAVYELSALAQRSMGDQTEPVVAATGRLVAFRDGVEQLARNVQTLRSGGLLRLGDGRTWSVKRLRGRWVEQNLAAADAWLEPQVRRLREAQERGTAEEAVVVVQETFRQRGQELRILLSGVAASAESQAMDRVVRISAWQLALMIGGIGLFLLGVFFLRGLLTTPLHRMADGIVAMHATGRLVKLPVLARNELGTVADGFNVLAQQVEDQKARLRDHIVELQRVNAELDQLAHVKDDFLTTVNHQFRTPLTAIIEGIELIRDGAIGSISAEQMSLIQAMDRNGKQLVALVEDILDLIMLRSGRRPLNRQPSDLAAVLRQAQATWQPGLNTKTVTLIHEALPQVHMDARAVGEVLDHLLRNALRHAPEQSEVLVTSQMRDGVVVVAVNDHGPGMSPEQLQQLFQPFTHVQTPEAPGSAGSGLGLAFCRQVIERHRGTIHVESVQGQGTTVTFTLPIASPQFLLQEACATGADIAMRENGQYALILVMPEAAHPAAASLIDEAAAVLRRNTHRNDLFVRREDDTLAIVAVTDQPGLDAMLQRLDRVVAGAGLAVRMGVALAPSSSGINADQLLDAARRNVRKATHESYGTRA